MLARGARRALEDLRGGANADRGAHLRRATSMGRRTEAHAAPEDLRCGSSSLESSSGEGLPRGGATRGPLAIAA